MEEIFEYIKTWWKQISCNHNKWDCDKQIRTIECRNCGKKAWIEEYTDLYKKIRL